MSAAAGGTTTQLARICAPLRVRGSAIRRLLLLTFATLAFFVGRPAWNQNSRLALTRALVERGTVQIDADHETTGDKSWRAGHYYSDKAPGASFLAVPAYAAFHLVRTLAHLPAPTVHVQPQDEAARAAGADADLSNRGPGDRVVYSASFRAALYVCTLAASVAPTTLAVAAVYLLALGAGAREREGLLVAGTYALSTLALPYGTSFYGHQACAGFLIAGAALVALARPGPGVVGATAAAGACLGVAVCSEYPALVPAVGLAIWAAVRLGWRAAGALALGAAGPALGLATYHTVAFGAPWALGYDFVALPEFAAGMEVRYGLGVPRPAVAFELLFGSYRGLLVGAPVLILALWGLARGVARATDGRTVSVAAAAIFLYAWLLSSGYYMWDGGSAAGPRHMLPALPFLALGLLPAWRHLPRATAILAGVGALHMLALSTAGPEAPPYGSPIWDYALPRLWRASATTDVAPGNLGLLLGLPGPASLLPLVALWFAVWRGRRATAGSP